MSKVHSFSCSTRHQQDLDYLITLSGLTKETKSELICRAISLWAEDHRKQVNDAQARAAAHYAEVGSHG